MLKQVSKSFRVNGHIVRALEDISLYAAEREFVSLIGPSGCGKSTLLNIICGLLEPDRGEILIHGRRGIQRLGQIGYMPQRDLLLPWRKLLDNILLGPEVMGRDLIEARRQAEALLPLFGLEGFQDSYPAQLSGGMRQRAALMRTLLCGQDIILLDEPLGALDALTRRAMRDWLLRVWERFQHTFIFVTHDVDEAVFLSDRIYVLSSRPGRIINELQIDLPRPRTEAMTIAPEFIAYRQEILNTLGV